MRKDDETELNRILWHQITSYICYSTILHWSLSQTTGLDRGAYWQQAEKALIVHEKSCKYVFWTDETTVKTTTGSAAEKRRKAISKT